MSEWIPEDEWETIVRNVPIVSVDLVVECPAGIVLGKRTNEPAKGEWFVPGGRVHKGEELTEAVHRVAYNELGVDVDIQASLGTFEHFYKYSDIGSTKHYLANGFYVWTNQLEFQNDTQHEAITVFESIPSNIHKYVEQYLDEYGDLK